MMKHQSINALVAKFAESVLRQNEAIRQHDPIAGNKFAHRYVNAYKELFALGGSGLDALASLFDHESMDVRAMAAAFLIRYKTDEAVKVLEEAAEDRGIVALGAQMALERWHKEKKGIEFD